MVILRFFKKDNKKAVNSFCSDGGSGKPLLQQESSRYSWAFLLSLAVSIWKKFTRFPSAKEKRIRLICLYYYSILLFLYHKLLFWFHAAKLRIKIETTKKSFFLRLCSISAKQASLLCSAHIIVAKFHPFSPSGKIFK